jgi:hypothetical protein
VRERHNLGDNSDGRSKKGEEAMTYPESEELFTDKPYVPLIDIDELLPNDFFDWDEIGIHDEKPKNQSEEKP